MTVIEFHCCPFVTAIMVVNMNDIQSVVEKNIVFPVFLCQTARDVVTISWSTLVE